MTDATRKLAYLLARLCGDASVALFAYADRPANPFWVWKALCVGIGTIMGGYAVYCGATGEPVLVLIIGSVAGFAFVCAGLPVDKWAKPEGK